MIVKKCGLSTKDALDYALEHPDKNTPDPTLKEKILLIDSIYGELYNIIRKMMYISDEIEDKTLKTNLIKILSSKPDYAGLDVLADQAVSTAKNPEDLNCVFLAHDIFLEHTNLIADKVLDITEIRF